MSDKKYHHGNLKIALIEAGIEMINECGEAGLSLRKVAAKCNVSQAAPYAHFKNKEDLIHAMQQHVTEQFMQILEASVKSEKKGSPEAILKIGEAYVLFFIEHPNYFRFLFFTPYLHIHLSLAENENIYPPYQLFREYALAYLTQAGVPKENMLNQIINMWATVQGVSLIATQENVTYSGDWKQDIRKILSTE